MAIAFDAASGRQTGTATSATLSHTCSTGLNRALIVSVGVATGQTVTGVTYNGVAMTQVVTGTTPSPSTIPSYMFILLNPASGTHNIVASFGASTAYGISGASYTGVRQTAQPDGGPTTVKENATGTRLATVSVTAPNCWLVGGGLITADANADSVSGGVLRTSVKQHDIIDSNGVVGTGNQTIGYVWSSTDNHVFFAFSLAPATDSGNMFLVF